MLALLTIGSGCTAGTRAEEPRASAAAEARAARFQVALDSLRAELGVVGATAAYALADGTVQSFGSGWADAEARIAMTPGSRLLSGSIGKTFVAAVALDLAQEGRLDLDDRVAKWLGDEPWYARLPNGERITLRHLLSHSAGLADHVYEPAFQVMVTASLERGEHSAADALGPVDLIALVCDQKPLFAPGEGFSYTDTGYLVAGLVLERAAGAPYYAELERRFLDPLGLDHTSPSNRRRLDGLAVGYLHQRRGRPARSVDGKGELVFDPALEWTGGGLVTTAGDLVRWATALYEGEAIEGDYLDDLLHSGYRGADANARYGLGVFLYDTPHGRAWGHPGWFPGYNSTLRYYPEHRIAVALQLNRDFYADRSALADRLLSAILDAD